MNNEYIITGDQMNILLQLIQEVPLKTSIRQYNTLQDVLKCPYIKPVQLKDGEVTLEDAALKE